MLHITALLIGFLTAHAACGPLSGLPYGGSPQRCGDEYLNELFADTPESCRRIAFYPDPDEPDFFSTACSSECGDILYRYYKICVSDNLAENFNTMCAENEDGIPCYSNIDDSYNTTIEIGSYCAESATERYFILVNNITGYGYYNTRSVFPGRCQNCSSLIESFKTSMGCCADTLMLSILYRPYGFTALCQSDIQPSVPTFCTLPFESEDENENASVRTMVAMPTCMGFLAVAALLPLLFQ